MTIRQLLAQLQEIAGNVPLGLDNEIAVVLCDGENMELSRDLEVSTLTWVTLAGEDREWVAMIRGHPHVDAAEGRQTHLPGVASDADDALREWTEGPDSE